MNTLRAEAKILIAPIPQPCSLVRSITITTLQHYRLPRATTTPTKKETRDKSRTTLLGSLAPVPLPLRPNSVIGSGVEVSLLHGPTSRDEAGYEFAVAMVRTTEALHQFTFFQGELEGELGQVEGGDQE
jgi:hypothetical protein